MNGLTRYTPGRELSLLRREMDRLFNDFTPANRQGEDTSTVWMPRADLAETADAFVLSFDLPGLTPENVEVTMEENTLTLSGERKAEQTEEGGRWHRIERTYGRFFRTVQFGTPVDAEQVEASFENGVLTVRVAKAEASKPRRIEVRGGRQNAGTERTWHKGQGDGHTSERKHVEVNEAS
jgi:HSP20 family protein